MVIVRNRSIASCVVSGILAAGCLAAAAPADAAGAKTADGAAARPAMPVAQTGSSWQMAGHDLKNDRFNPAERTISRKTAHQLALAWSHPFTNYVSATPTVVNGTVYYPDNGGTLWAFSADTGAVLWSHLVSDYTGLVGDYTRNSPAYSNGMLFFGDRTERVTSPDGAHVMAVNATTGALLWNTIVDTNPSSLITGSPAVAGNTVYIGVSSHEEDQATCCTFRGSVVALNATTGAVKWRRMTAPPGYTGVAVWSSSPVVDSTTGLVYVGTGNNYTVPAGVCTMPQQQNCNPHAPNDYVDSLLALHANNGQVAWVFNTLADDVSSYLCNSPSTCGPDFDFGSDPNEFTATINGQQRRLLGIGQKSGVYWAVDAVTGQHVWHTQVGPGGVGGGIEWGSATDGQRIYVAEANSSRQSWQLSSGQTVTGGAFTALDPVDGHIVWQRGDPQGARDPGFVSVANGVAYFGSDEGATANMYAVNTANGTILWSYASKGAAVGGAAIVNGTVYWASGYRYATCPASQPKCGTTKGLYAFRLAP